MYSLLWWVNLMSRLCVVGFLPLGAWFFSDLSDRPSSTNNKVRHIWASVFLQPMGCDILSSFNDSVHIFRPVVNVTIELVLMRQCSPWCYYLTYWKALIASGISSQASERWNALTLSRLNYDGSSGPWGWTRPSNRKRVRSCGRQNLSSFRLINL